MYVYNNINICIYMYILLHFHIALLNDILLKYYKYIIAIAHTHTSYIYIIIKH